MKIFYFYLVCFTFSISYSVPLFHFLYVLRFLLIDFLLFFLKPLSILAENLLCVCVYDPCILASNITVERLESLLSQWLKKIDEP